MASVSATSEGEKNRKLGGILLGIILLLVAISIIGVLTLN
jgi:hypothetical protein